MKTLRDHIKLLEGTMTQDPAFDVMVVRNVDPATGEDNQKLVIQDREGNEFTCLVSEIDSLIDSLQRIKRTR